MLGLVAQNYSHIWEVTPMHVPIRAPICAQIRAPICAPIRMPIRTPIPDSKRKRDESKRETSKGVFYCDREKKIRINELIESE